MKRTLIAAAAVLAAGTAFAQSSVTLYGRVNTSVEYQKASSGNKTVLENNASRWGIRGTEDIGGGLKGLFVLESGFNSDNGGLTRSGLFDREAWVGLQGNFGRVRLGNLGATAAYYAIADYISMHNHDTGTSGDALYLFGGGSNSGIVGASPVNLRNAIAYNTPSFGGLVVEGQFGLKETVTGGKNVGVVAANYDRGPLHLGASFVKGPGTVTGSVVPAPATETDAKEYGLRALYELGAFTVGAYYVCNDIDTTTAGKLKRDAYRVAGMYSFGANELHVNVGFADNIKGVAGDTSAIQYTVGYNYNLSKRTKLYAFYTKVDNKTGIAYSPFVNTSTNTVNAGSDPSAVAIGVRHNF